MRRDQQLLALALGGLAVLGYFAWRRAVRQAAVGVSVVDDLDALMSEARNAITGSPVADMQPSDAVKDMLRGSERLRLYRYRLGDGGWTIGWGRFYPDSGPPPPEQIDRATADRWFDEDVEARAARWVRAYVTRPLQQHEFDALVHIAYNLSPKSFRNVADAVNRGEGPHVAALQYVRAGTNLEAGLRNRREREFALWDAGLYHIA